MSAKTKKAVLEQARQLKNIKVFEITGSLTEIEIQKIVQTLAREGQSNVRIFNVSKGTFHKVTVYL